MRQRRRLRRRADQHVRDMEARSICTWTCASDSDCELFAGAECNGASRGGQRAPVDTLHHDQQTTIEGLYINKSLLALKDVIHGLGSCGNTLKSRFVCLSTILSDGI